MQWNSNKQTEIVTSVARLDELFQEFADAKYLAFDLESTGLQRFSLGVGIGLALSEDKGIYIPFSIYNKAKDALERPWTDEAWSYIKDWVQAQLMASRRLIGHNSSYDCKIISNTLGFDPIKMVISDTQLLHHTVISESPPHGLKPLATRYLTPDAESAQEDLKVSVVENGGRWLANDKPFWRGNYKILGHYCIMDVLYTYGLFNRFTPELEKNPVLLKLWNEEVLPLLEVTHELNTTGIRIDVNYFKQLKQEMLINISNIESIIFSEIEDKIEDYEVEIVLDKYKVTHRTKLGKYLMELGWDQQETTIRNYKKAIRDWYKAEKGIKYVLNLDSSQDKAFILFDILGLPSDETTATGKRKVTTAIIEKLEEQYAENSEILKLMVQRSKEIKLLTTYVDAFLEQHIDGRIYPSFNQTGTTSGRYSSDSPNFQNIPAKDNRIKKGIVPDEGYVIVNADYSSLEPRIFSETSNESDLIDLFKKGDDFYCTIAIKMFNLKGYSANPNDPNYLGTLDKDTRTKVKPISLGIAYGARAGRIAQMIGVSYEEANELVNDYLEAFPNLKKWMQTSEYKMKFNGYVESIVGRRKRGDLVKKLYNQYKVKDFSKKALKLVYDRYSEFNQNPKYKDAISFYLEVNNLLNVGKNHCIQSLAASVCNAGMIELKQALEKENMKTKIAIQCHDEVTLLSPIEESEKAAKMLQYYMTTNKVTKQLRVQILAEPKIAINLYEAK